MNLIDKYLELIEEKEVLYKENCVETNGLIEIRDVKRILKDFAREMESEFIMKHLHQKD